MKLKLRRRQDTHTDAWLRLLEDHPELADGLTEKVRQRRALRLPDEGACLAALHEGRVWVVNSLPIPMAVELIDAHGSNDYEMMDRWLAVIVSQMAEAMYT